MNCFKRIVLWSYGYVIIALLLKVLVLVCGFVFKSKENPKIETSGTMTEKPTLKDLKVGETVFVVPWCYNKKHVN